MPGEATLPGGRAFHQGRRRVRHMAHAKAAAAGGAQAARMRRRPGCTWQEGVKQLLGGCRGRGCRGRARHHAGRREMDQGARHFLADVFYNDNYNGEVVRCPEVAWYP